MLMGSFYLWSPRGGRREVGRTEGWLPDLLLMSGMHLSRSCFPSKESQKSKLYTSRTGYVIFSQDSSSNDFRIIQPNRLTCTHLLVQNPLLTFFLGETELDSHSITVWSSEDSLLGFLHPLIAFFGSRVLWNKMTHYTLKSQLIIMRQELSNN